MVEGASTPASSRPSIGPQRTQATPPTMAAPRVAPSSHRLFFVVTIVTVTRGLLSNLDRRRGGAAEDLRFVHLFRVRRGSPEGARGGRARDVAERVQPFAEPRREELDAIVVALDVIEAA